MVEIQKVNKLTGNIELPPNPDYFFLSLILTLSSNKSVKITPIHDSPLLRIFENIFHEHLDIIHEGMNYYVSNKKESISSCLILPYDLVPYRDFIIPFLLGLKKKISFKNFPKENLEALEKKASKFGLSIESTQTDDLTNLILSNEDDFKVLDKIIPVRNIHFFIGLALGLKLKLTVNIDYQFQSPLRHILPLFGYEVIVKSNIERVELDPLTRRMHFLSPKLKKKNKPKLSFLLNLDFVTQKNNSSIDITLPGDDILASVLLTAKTLIPRGQLLLDNVPLEPWNSAIITFLRKMGCTMGIQETQKSSFGSVGLISIEKFNLVGQKMDCKPLYQYIRQLPAMLILATFATGRSVFRSLNELRDEMPDSINQMLYCIGLLGGRYGEMPDGIVVDGVKEFDGFDITENYSAGLNSACAVAGLKCSGKTFIEDKLILQRWPNFNTLIQSISEM